MFFLNNYLLPFFLQQQQATPPPSAAQPPQPAQQQCGPVPPPRPPSSTAPPPPQPAAGVPTAYNDKVVAFLRQPNILDILRERHPPVHSDQALREKVAAVRQDGTQAIDRLSHDIDLTILLR